MKPLLRVVDSKQEHARDTARRLVAERGSQKPLPVVNIHDSYAPTLMVDDVLKSSLRAIDSKK